MTQDFSLARFNPKVMSSPIALVGTVTALAIEGFWLPRQKDH
jgi:hypothetical protein